MVKDIKKTSWVGLEYFCNENDEFWSNSDKKISDIGIEEMIKLKMIDTKDNIWNVNTEKEYHEDK